MRTYLITQCSWNAYDQSKLIYNCFILKHLQDIGWAIELYG